MNFFCKVWYWFWFCVLYIPLSIFYPVKIINKSNGKFKGHKIFICNHLHNLDPVMLCIRMGVRVRFVAKKELFENRFVGGLFKSLGAIPIDRYNTDIAAMKKIMGVLKQNEQMVICPEGTRNKKSEDAQEVKKGAILFALKTKSPLVPCCYTRRLKFMRRTSLVIGEPFDFSEYYGQPITKELLDKLSVKLSDSIWGLKY